MKNPEFYQELSILRSDDVFPDHTFANMLLDNVFPKSIAELALKLSNVTSAFYGLTLKQMAEHCGKENIDPVSRYLGTLNKYYTLRFVPKYYIYY
jgi:hypothetical protein